MTEPVSPSRHLHPEATRVLVLGFLGLSICPVTAPIAWRMGDRVLLEIDESERVTSNRPSALVGRWLGLVATVIWALVLCSLAGLAVAGGLSSLLD